MFSECGIEHCEWGIKRYYELTILLISILARPCLPIKQFFDEWTTEMSAVGERDFARFEINTLRPRQNGRHVASDSFKCIFLNENVWILFRISLKFIPMGPNYNISALSEQMMVWLPTHICVSRPQWVRASYGGYEVGWARKDRLWICHILQMQRIETFGMLYKCNQVPNKTMMHIVQQWLLRVRLNMDQASQYKIGGRNSSLIQLLRNLFLPEHTIQLSNYFENLHRTQHWYYCDMCERIKLFYKWAISQDVRSFCEIWV